MDGGARWATVHGVSKSWTRLSHFTLLVIGTQICSFNTTKGCVRVQEGQEELLHVRRGGPDEIPLVQGKGQWQRFPGADVNRYTMTKVRETQERQLVL